MPKKFPKIALIQARKPGDPMQQHELECFQRQTGLPQEAFIPINLPESPIPEQTFSSCDAIMIGGSGAFSFVDKIPPWKEELFEFLQTAIDKKIPTFGSCFGFQAIALLLGGQIERMDGNGEVGSFEISLTEEGTKDPLFGLLPQKFTAQLGHIDKVTHIPNSLKNLASSKLSPYQALRIPNAPIVATQFHPELSREDNLKRYIYYIDNYYSGPNTKEEEIEKAKREFRESPESSALLPLFLYLELEFKSPLLEKLPNTIKGL